MLIRVSNTFYARINIDPKNFNDPTTCLLSLNFG